MQHKKVALLRDPHEPWGANRTDVRGLSAPPDLPRLRQAPRVG